MEKSVFIIGLGLIGGSLALCIKNVHPNIKIFGYDINKVEMNKAVKLGIIDEMVEDLPKGAKNADFIFISAPVLETAKILGELANLPLKEGVIISDTGSTKVEIVKAAKLLREKNITFIGGHPMAGSHKSGVLAAKSILFENAFYLLTPIDGIADEKIESLKTLLNGTNAKFLIMSAEEHDRLTGVISHFPHLIAASIVHQAEKSSKNQALVPRLAAGGFRDITRIASSSPEMWRDILLHNKAVLVDLLNDWIKEMDYVKEIIEQENAQSIFDYFHKAKQFRDLLPIKEKGAIPAFYDLFVDVPDFPGVISEVTAYLADENISITNIRIIETREEIYGILVISFQTDIDRSRAMECISNKTNYAVSVDS
ncbi:prephenate dehydrogenase [Bacillus sp. CGMCC 1.16607]|uniref:prephenate dehydrogenase n=1 Tax=Bacillus sp. CGMCC 1.16607 TaxID=3351842 RepID=UPI003642E351